MVSQVADAAAVPAAPKGRRRPGRRTGNQMRQTQEETCESRSTLRPEKGGGTPSGASPGLKPARSPPCPSSEDSSRRTFRPYHALAVPRGPHPLGAANTGGHSSKPITTAMLRNIPNKYTQNSLLEEIHEAGYADTYDFFYLPMDVHNRANVGYAFINFLKPEDMDKFTESFTDYVFQKHPSLKIARVSPAHIQGLVKNLRHFSNRAVTWSRNSQYRPIVRYQGVHRDLCELLAELPLTAEEEGGEEEEAKPEAEAAVAQQEDESAVSTPPPEGASTLNPEAAEFVPVSDPAGAAAGRTFLRPDAGIFVPQAMLGVPEGPELGAVMEAMLAVPEVPELGVDMEVAPPPGLEELFGYDVNYHSVDETTFASESAACDEGDLSTPPGFHTEDAGAELASQPFTLASQGLQDAVSKWLREGCATQSAGGSSSTRSSSNGTTPRSVGTPAC